MARELLTKMNIESRAYNTKYITIIPQSNKVQGELFLDQVIHKYLRKSLVYGENKKIIVQSLVFTAFIVLRFPFLSYINFFLPSHPVHLYHK